MKIFPSWLCLILVFSRRLSSSTLVCSVLSWNSSYSHFSRSFLLSVRANFLSALVKFVVHYGISKDIRVECRISAIIQRSLWLTKIKLIKDLVRDCWNAFTYLWSASISSFLMSFPSHVSSSDSPEKQMRKTFIFESRYNAFDKKNEWFLRQSISFPRQSQMKDSFWSNTYYDRKVTYLVRFCQTSNIYIYIYIYIYRKVFRHLSLERSMSNSRFSWFIISYLVVIFLVLNDTHFHDHLPVIISTMSVMINIWFWWITLYHVFLSFSTKILLLLVSQFISDILTTIKRLIIVMSYILIIFHFLTISYDNVEIIRVRFS